jgi:hypothetical protein
MNHHQLQSLQQHQGGQMPVSVSNVLCTSNSQTVVLTNAQTYTTGGSMLSLPMGKFVGLFFLNKNFE